MITLSVLFLAAFLTILFKVTKLIAKIWLRIFIFGFFSLAAIILFFVLII